ncbi:MAG: hypothetical protein CM15mP120_29830 [Pseudomonadota bacterium]|nr:MAG: hypothetical protein CM15mP120_29830 [Pseudomonadota bacterium]
MAGHARLSECCRSKTRIKGVDDNDITLYIHQPADRAGPLPCLVHTHGGGMVLMTAADPVFVRWRNTLASMGLVVVGVEFRNGAASSALILFLRFERLCQRCAVDSANRRELDISTPLFRANWWRKLIYCHYLKSQAGGLG